MSAIITPELVRRYLRATGWTLGERGFLVKRASEVGLFDAMTVFDLDREIDKIAFSERRDQPKTGASELAARLGMLAAADDLLDRSREYFAQGDSLLGTSKAADGMRLVVRAGVDPSAWDKTRQT